MQTRSISLKDLRFGHEAPQGGINDRVTGRDAEIGALAAMIAVDGLLQPLAIWANEGSKPPYFVIAGNRRLAALQLLAKKAKGANGSDAVECVLIDAMDVNDALAKAVGSNMYVPPHPVDQYEAFARLAASGMNAAAIAHHYGIGEVKSVERSLALGALAPEILSAWRERRVGETVAKAFTLEPDKKRQAEIFAKLKKAHNLHGDYAVRAAILGDVSRSSAMLKFVTPGAYKAAGGRIRVDLFSEGGETIPIDAALLKKLVDAKLATEADKLVKAGWKWAEPIAGLPTNAEFVWPRTGNGAKSSKEDKAKSGCGLKVSYDGGLDIVYGLMRPKDAKAAATGKDAKPDKPKKAKADPKALSSALAARLDTQVALAVQDVLLATAGSELVEGVCNMAAGMIAPERMSWSSIKIDEVRTLMALAPPKEMQAALLKRFDAKDYFASIPTALTLKLLRDELSHPAIGPKTGKGELVAIAVKAAAAAKWLPIQMRPAAAKKKGR